MKPKNPKQQMKNFGLDFLKLSVKLTEQFSPNLAAQLAIKFMAKPKRYALKDHKFFQQAKTRVVRHKLWPLKIYEWGSGPTVLLVHGWSGQTSDMCTIVGPLLSSGFHVVAFDAPGHGRSSGWQTNIKDYGAAIFNVCRQLNIAPYAVVAHSFGGSATTYLASTQPTFHPQKIVLIGTPAYLEEALEHTQKLLNLNPQSCYLMRQKMESILGHPLAELNVPNFAKKIRISALIVHDKDDKAVAFHNAESISKSWKDSETFWTNGLGHKRILNDPTVIQRILNFIS